jgi:hypothetical protein
MGFRTIAHNRKENILPWGYVGSERKVWAFFLRILSLLASGSERESK